MECSDSDNNVGSTVPPPEIKGSEAMVSIVWRFTNFLSVFIKLKCGLQ